MKKQCTFKGQSPEWAIMYISGYKQHSQPEAKAIPGGPVVKNLHFHQGEGTQILHDERCSQKKKKVKIKETYPIWKGRETG